MRRFTVAGLVPCDPIDLADRLLDASAAPVIWPQIQLPPAHDVPGWLECSVSDGRGAGVTAPIPPPVCGGRRAVGVRRPRGGGAAGRGSPSTLLGGRGWQGGISWGVRLGAMMPAPRATPRTSPLGASPAEI